MLTEWINQSYLGKAKTIKKSFKKEPFSHHFLTNFFIKTKIDIVKKEIEKEHFEEKNTDLFHIHQTKDLNNSKNKKIKNFIQFLSSSEFKNFISNITSIKVRRKIDISSLKLKKTSYLLCHDDQLTKRKIALIIYLSTLKKSDGGLLSFFSTKKNKPKKIVKSFSPQYNTLMIFEVSKKSFHQIDEVITNKERITIGGWFHD